MIANHEFVTQPRRGALRGLRRVYSIVVLLLGVGAPLLPVGCQGTQGAADEPRGTESHFLSSCEDDSDCGSLQCFDGVCSASCESSSDCAELASESSCELTIAGGSCVLECSADADCFGFGARDCSGGYCEGYAGGAVNGADDGNSDDGLGGGDADDDDGNSDDGLDGGRPDSGPVDNGSEPPTEETDASPGEPTPDASPGEHEPDASPDELKIDASVENQSDASPGDQKTDASIGAPRADAGDCPPPNSEVEIGNAYGEVTAVESSGLWIFTYEERNGEDALVGGTAGMRCGCLTVSDAVVIWDETWLEVVEDIAARVRAGEAPQVNAGGGGGISLVPAVVYERCGVDGVIYQNTD